MVEAWNFNKDLSGLELLGKAERTMVEKIFSVLVLGIAERLLSGKQPVSGGVIYFKEYGHFFIGLKSIDGLLIHNIRKVSEDESANIQIDLNRTGKLDMKINC